MVTENRLVTDYNALSTDKKPMTNNMNGDSYYEMDLKRLYFWDASTERWDIWCSGTDPASSVVGIGAVGYMKVGEES